MDLPHSKKRKPETQKQDPTQTKPHTYYNNKMCMLRLILLLIDNLYEVVEHLCLNVTRCTIY